MPLLQSLIWKVALLLQQASMAEKVAWP